MVIKTFYPAAGSYGTVKTELSSWSACHGATTGSVDSNSGSFPFIEVFNNGSVWKIWRYFCPFDTSSIPDDATIVSAELIMDCYSVTNTDADGNDFITVVQTTQASSSTLVATDYDNVGTTKGSADVDVDDIATRINYSWDLNSTGLGWINKTGTTFLGLREGHDLNNSSISANTQVSLRVYQANTNEPKLIVNYTLPLTPRLTIF